MLLNLQQFIFLTFPQVKARFGNLQGKEQIFTFHFARMKLILLEGRRLCLSIGSMFKEEKEEKENKTQNHSSHSMLHLEAQHAWEEGFPKLCISLDCTLAMTAQQDSDHKAQHMHKGRSKAQPHLRGSGFVVWWQRGPKTWSQAAWATCANHSTISCDSLHKY